MKKRNAIKELLEVGPWYVEGHAVEVAEAVLRGPERFDQLFECLLDPDKGISKRASFALMLVSARHPEWFQPYKEVLFDEIAGQEKWFVRYRLCRILPRLRLVPADIARAAAIFEAMLEEPRVALNAAALQGLGELALLDPGGKEEAVWLIESKMRSGSPGVRAGARKVLRRLYRSDRQLKRNGIEPATTNRQNP